MKCFSQCMAHLRKRSCLIMVPVAILAFINLLCAWKDTYWQDKELELNKLQVAVLRKRRIANPKVLTKSWQSKAIPRINRPFNVRRWKKRKERRSTKRAIRWSKAQSWTLKNLGPVDDTISRKRDDNLEMRKKEQFAAKAQRVSGEQGAERKVREDNSGEISKSWRRTVV